MAVIRQLCLNIPVLFLLDALFGMNGIIYARVRRQITAEKSAAGAAAL